MNEKKKKFTPGVLIWMNGLTMFYYENWIQNYR